MDRDLTVLLFKQLSVRDGRLWTGDARGLDKAKSQASVNLISLSFIVFNIIHE